MSDEIRVGDVCVIVVKPIGEVSKRYNGAQCTVLRLAVATGIFGVMHQCELFDGIQANIAAMFLRKVPPKQQDDSEPRTQFTPADPEGWDITHWNPDKVREEA